jgi:hypothetical protein
MQNDNSYRMTTWFNPLSVPQTFTVYDGGPRGRKIVVPAKGEIQFDSAYDHAIQHVQAGVIMGGLAPQLVNKSADETPKLHESLDTELQKRRMEEAQAAHAENMRQLANDAAILAASRLNQSDKRK